MTSELAAAKRRQSGLCSADKSFRHTSAAVQPAICRACESEVGALARKLPKRYREVPMSKLNPAWHRMKQGKWHLPVCLGIALCFSLLPQYAIAHIVHGAQGGFGSGFGHPLTGPDHFLAMFAVGLWGAQMGGRSVWTLPVLFPLIMVVGGIGGMLGIPFPGIEIGIALSVLALGLAIVFVWRPLEWIALILIGFFALCHGHAHGAELPLAADPADYAIGFVLATGMIHLFGIGVGFALNKPLSGSLARGLGALISLGGVYFLVSAFLAA